METTQTRPIRRRRYRDGKGNVITVSYYADGSKFETITGSY